jgi:putative Mg2+ transporter-C (MgtC) family protein
MGLRTFPLVALASCGYVLIATSTTGPTDVEARMRVLQGLMAGIGFIGGGAILKRKSGVRGTATAASVWATGAVGAAAGFGEFGIAGLIAGLNFLVLRVLTPIERRMRGRDGSTREDALESEDG